MDDALLSFPFPGSNSVYRKTLQIIYTSKQVNVCSFTSWCKLSGLFSKSALAERKRTVRKPSSSPPPYPLNITDTYHNKTESIATWNSLFHTYLSASVTCRRAALFPPHRHTHSSSAWLTGPDVLYTATVCTHSCFFATAHCPRARNTADVIQTSPPPPPPPLSRAAFSHCPTLVCKVGRCLLTRK